MPDQPDRRAFGPFVADLSKELLWRDEELVRVPRRTFQVLALLVRHAGEVLEKREIFDAIWGTTVVEENTLARHIATLRRILDDGPEHKYIATVPGWGYRFVAQVVDADATAPLPERDGQIPEVENVHVTFSTEPERPVEGGDGRRSTEPTPTGSVTTVWSPAAVPATPWRPFLFAAVPTSALLVTLIVTVLTHRTSGAPSVGRALRQVTYGQGLQQQPSWSPDERYLVFASDRSGNLDLWIQGVDDTSARQLTSTPSHDSEPAWAPDGRSIAFRSEREGGGLYVIGADGTVERRLTDFGYRPRWSSDGRSILFSNRRVDGIPQAASLFVVGSAGGNPRPLLVDDLRAFRSASVQWTPGDATVSVWGYTHDGAPAFGTAAVTGSLTRWRLTPDLLAQLHAAEVTLGEFAWAPSRQFLYFDGETNGVRNVWRVAVDSNARTLTGTIERLTTSPALQQDIAVSPSGARLAFSSRVESKRLRSFPFDNRTGRVTGPGVPLTSGTSGDEGDPSVADDGQRLIYRATRGGREDLWQLSLANRSERLLLSNAAWRRTNPHWSRDGRLVYRKTRTAAAPEAREGGIVVMPGDGGAEQVIAPGAMSPSDWSPDGATVLGTCEPPVTPLFTVCLLALRNGDTSSPRVVAADPLRNMFAQRISPDQSWISFITVKGPISTIYVARPDGGPWVRVSDLPAWDDKVRWAPDGRALYWASDRTGRFNVWGRRFDPVAGKPVGAAFPMTSLDNPQQGLPASIKGLEIALTADRLIAPIIEAAGGVWIIDHPDR
jgi:Tol biopolymer transport system component/DNA-binding winged helix-turn-helix (wHTH) protein